MLGFADLTATGLHLNGFRTCSLSRSVEDFPPHHPRRATGMLAIGDAGIGSEVVAAVVERTMVAKAVKGRTDERLVVVNGPRGHPVSGADMPRSSAAAQKSPQRTGTFSGTENVTKGGTSVPDEENNEVDGDSDEDGDDDRHGVGGGLGGCCM